MKEITANRGLRFAPRAVMTAAFRARLMLLLGAIIIIAGLTLWGVQHSWVRISQLERRLTSSQFESFHLAQEFQDRLLSLNNHILRFAAGGDSNSWTQFTLASAELDRWIDQYDARSNKNAVVTSQRERDLFIRINENYEDYMRAASTVRTNQPIAKPSAEAFRELDNFEERAQQLLQLSLQLANAHRESEQAFLHAANASLSNLRLLITGGVVFLLCLTAVAGVVLYRDMIAPLRFKVVQSEAMLERQEKLVTLGTLAAGIAHEIRNPLTSIKARLYTLGKHIPGNEVAANDAALISGEISRLERIVQDVLQFARPSEPQFRVVLAEEPLREVISLMSGSLDKSRVDLVLEPCPELYTRMDTSLIKQVIINLVRNAAEAIDPPGTITLRVRQSRAQVNGVPQDAVILEVADTGKGIPAEIEERLFDPFFTTKETGTGLGLSVAARIVEKHSGILQYQTRMGRGTTFGIVLPQAEKV